MKRLNYWSKIVLFFCPLKVEKKMKLKNPALDARVRHAVSDGSWVHHTIYQWEIVISTGLKLDANTNHYFKPALTLL